MRLLPTKEQETKMYKFNGACRFIWNKCLEYQIKQYSTYADSLYIKSSKIYFFFKKFERLFTLLKNKSERFKWLESISRHSLLIIIKELKQDYNNYFRHQSLSSFRQFLNIDKSIRKYHPRFKKKKDNEVSIPFDGREVYFKTIEGKLYFQIPKMGKVLVQTNRSFPEGYVYTYKHGKQVNRYSYIKDPRIKFINNKWMLIFCMDIDNQNIQKTDNILGIDLGIKELCVCSDGTIFHNINKTNKHLKRLDKRINHLQRLLSLKLAKNNFNKSNNINKIITSLKKVYFKTHNIRVNYLHHVSKQIILKLPSIIVLEDMDLGFMIKNHNISKSSNDQLLGEFRYMLKYKSENYGIKVILANRFYPSTQLCSACNHKQYMELKERTFLCAKCGLEIDRDLNAAINLEHYGSQLISLRKKLVDVLKTNLQK